MALNVLVWRQALCRYGIFGVGTRLEFRRITFNAFQANLLGLASDFLLNDLVP